MALIKKNTPARITAYVVAALGLLILIFWFLFMTPIGSFFGTKW